MQRRTVFAVLAGMAQCRSAVLKGQGPSSLAEVVRILDTDNSGSVEKKEMEVYAKVKGLNTLSARREFHDLDKNGDGSLGSLELLALGVPGAQQLVEESTEAKEEGDLLNAAKRFVPASPAVPPSLLLTDQKASAIPQAALKDLIATPAAHVTLTDQKASPAQQAQQAILTVAVAGDGAVKVDVSSVTGEGFSSLMDSSSLLLEVRGESRRAVAETFSRQAEEVLARRAANEDRAAQLEERARGLRQDAAELMKSVPQVVADESLLAVQEESQQGFAEASVLKDQAEQNEQGATKARAQALSAMKEAKRAQGSVMGEIQQLRAPNSMRGM